MMMSSVNLANPSDPDTMNGWTKVKTNIPVDLETTPLEIKTSGRRGKLTINFQTEANTGPDADAGSITIRLDRNPSQYEIYDCELVKWDYFNPRELPDETEKIWRISITRSELDPRKRLHIHCNDVQVVNTILDKSREPCMYYGNLQSWGWDKDAKYVLIDPYDSLRPVATSYRIQPELEGTALNFTVQNSQYQYQ